MRREIKFRAWDRTSGIMRDDIASIEYGSTGKVVQINVVSGADILFPEKEAALMQYTGLKDKNGVEIYEGDVILTADDLRKQAVGNWKPKMRVVEWTDNKEYKTGFNLGRAQDGKCEVIGNVYENRELLDAKGN